MKWILILCCITYTCCSSPKLTKIIGTYESTCRLYIYPSLTVTLRSDNTFTYNKALLDEEIAGNWQIKKDTLFLYSDTFERKTISFDELLNAVIANPDTVDLPPIFDGKFTENENMDAYLIRRKRLYKLTQEGHTKECYLIKIQQ